MRIRVLLFSILVIFSCKNGAEKGSEKTQINVDSTETKSAPIDLDRETIESELEFEDIAQIIESTFQYGDLELTPAYGPLEDNYYTLIDSSKVKSFKRYLIFLIIEFNTPLDAKYEFAKIKAIAEKSRDDKNVLNDYSGVFSKSGISFNQIDRWIITHSLRCNMLAKDYELDKKLTAELEKMNLGIDWLRCYCGWAKMEIK